MSAADLIGRLIEIEKEVGIAHPLVLREMVVEAEGCVLEIEQQMIEVLRDNARLRERLEKCEAQKVLAAAAPAAREKAAAAVAGIAAELSRALGR